MKLIMKIGFAGVGAIVLAACSTNQGYIHNNSGIAAKQAVEYQIVDKSASPGAPEIHPDKVAAAVDRYLNDEVKQPGDKANIEFGSGQTGADE